VRVASHGAKHFEQTIANSVRLDATNGRAGARHDVHAVTASGDALLKGPQIHVLLVHSANPKNGAQGVVQFANWRWTKFLLSG